MSGTLKFFYEQQARDSGYGTTEALSKLVTDKKQPLSEEKKCNHDSETSIIEHLPDK
jgi:hypothetical protein